MLIAWSAWLEVYNAPGPPFQNLPCYVHPKGMVLTSPTGSSSTHGTP